MAYRSVEDSSLTGIADAIRAAGETEESLLFPEGFQTAISNLGGKGAALTVTAPAGSTVTVSKDGKTLTRLAGADGVAVFRGLVSGTWTLTITDGTHTKSIPVDVITNYTVIIDFRVTLFDNGDQCVDVSGGWSAYAYRHSESGSSVVTPKLTIADTGMTITVKGSNTYNVGSVFCESAIDITHRSKLVFDVTGSSLDGSSGAIDVGVAQAKQNSYTRLSSVVCPIGETGKFAVDLSNISGNYYIYISIAGVIINKSCTITISKIYME